MNYAQISQKLMVQGYSGHAKYNGGLDVARKVLKSDGIRGLYRGFGLSVMTYSPSSAVWWASYGSSQRVIWRLVMITFVVSFSLLVLVGLIFFHEKELNVLLELVIIGFFFSWYFVGEGGMLGIDLKLSSHTTQTRPINA